MGTSDLISVVPLTNAALQAVTTPFVSFIQPFDERIAWRERQLEGMYVDTAAVILGDTWPDAYHDPIQWGRAADMLSEFGGANSRACSRLWPETAIYQTAVAKLFKIDEQIRYRPHMHFFCKYYDSCAKEIRHGDDMELSPEAAIYVEDRGIYPVGYPKLKFNKADKLLSIIAIGPDNTKLDTNVPTDDIQYICDQTSEPTASLINKAIEKATGTYIALASTVAKSCNSRFLIQLADNVDLSIGAVSTPAGLAAWIPFHYAQHSAIPSNVGLTMMINRSLFEKLGGFCEELHVGFEYDLYLRATANEFNIVQHTEPLLCDEAYSFPYGIAYTHNVYADAANRIRSTKGYHGRTIRR